MSAARLTTLRLTRSPRALVAICAWLAVAIVAAMIERGRSWPSAGHVLLGAHGAIALPLLVYAVVGATVAGGGLGRAGRSLTAFGADPVRTAATTILVAAIASAVLCAASSALVATLRAWPRRSGKGPATR